MINKSDLKMKGKKIIKEKNNGNGVDIEKKQIHAGKPLNINADICKILINYPYPAAITDVDGYIIFLNDSFSSFKVDKNKRPKKENIFTFIESGIKQSKSDFFKKLNHKPVILELKLLSNGILKEHTLSILPIDSVDNNEYRLWLFSPISGGIDQKESNKVETTPENFVKADLPFEPVSIPIIFHSLDFDGNILEVNDNWLDTFGYQKDEVIGKNFSDYLDERDKENFRVLFEKFKADGKIIGLEMKVLNKQSNVIYLIFDGIIIKDSKGKFLKTYCLSTDITKRVENELALRESQERFITLAENAPLMIWMTDKEGKLIYVSSEWQRYTGRSQQYALDGGWEDYIHPEDRSDIDDLLNDFQMNGYFEVECRILGAKNEYKWFYHKGVPFFDSSNEFLGVIGSSIDIHGRKIAEQTLERYSSKLKELNDSKDRFFSILAHDLKSPLSSFVGITQELSRDIDSIDHDELSSSAGIMYDFASQVYKLLENLLEWSTVQLNTLELKIADFNLYYLVDNCISSIHHLAEQKNLKINNQVENIMVKMDINVFNTIMRNVLTNAIKFSYSNSEIIISAVQRDGIVMLSVKDFGIGITNENMEKLFKIDSRQSEIGTSGETGTGLGLILCRELITKYGGTLEIESLPEKGATVTITLIPA